MDWQDVRWSMPLESAPIIVHIGENIHGRKKDEEFVLPDLWCLHLYSYEGRLEIDGHLLPIKPGYIGISPPGSAIIYHYLGRSPHLYAHFSIAPVGPTFRVPAMRDLRDEYVPTAESFREALRFWSINKQRSVVRLWDILWKMADVSHQDLCTKSNSPESVQRALAYVDTHLHEPMSIESLAESQGISHNHFTRVFRAATGKAPLEYIQNRRAAQAKHLLVYSSIPIKAVAASIGISDPQIFNKFVKHYLGRSPKKLRDIEQAKVGLMD